MSERRAFNRSEHQALYLAADGHCQRCGSELKFGWHADHVIPFVKGGQTILANGAALCPSCNLRKGAQLSPFTLRPFQEELVTTVLDRWNQDKTVAWVYTGSGKTFGWIAAIDRAAQDNLIDKVAVYTPRLNLCKQADSDFQAYSRFVGGHTLGRVGYSDNNPPLCPAELGGFIATFQGAVAAEGLHLAWAQKHKQRFALVLDEAQLFCVDDEETNYSTATGAVMTQLMQLAAHTIILFGTDRRSDKRPILGCDYISDPNNAKEKLLDWHVRASYRQGVTEGYLRPFEYQLLPGTVSLESLDGQHAEDLDITEMETRLYTVLKSRLVWEPIVDHVLDTYRNRRKIHADYRALVTCIDQDQARDVERYIRQHHPDVRSIRAISDDEDAHQVLRSFRKDGYDAEVLITVRMAYIGYDCKPITVVGILTHYRHEGHLEQIVGRGLRMWNSRPLDEQVTYVVGPDDPQFVRFVQRMREDSIQAQTLRELKQGQDDDPFGDDPSVSENEIPLFPPWMVTDADINDPRAIGLDADVDAMTLKRIEIALRQSGIAASATQAKSFIDAFNMPSPKPSSAEASDETWQEEIDRLSREQNEWAKRCAATYHRQNPKLDFGEVMSAVYHSADEIDRLGFKNGGKIGTPENLKIRIQTLRQLLADLYSDDS